MRGVLYIKGQTYPIKMGRYGFEAWNGFIPYFSHKMCCDFFWNSFKHLYFRKKWASKYEDKIKKIFMKKISKKIKLYRESKLQYLSDKEKENGKKLCYAMLCDKTSCLQSDIIEKILKEENLDYNKLCKMLYGVEFMKPLTFMPNNYLSSIINFDKYEMNYFKYRMIMFSSDRIKILNLSLQEIYRNVSIFKKSEKLKLSSKEGLLKFVNFLEQK